MFKVEGENEFNQGLDRWADAMEQLATGALRGTAVRAYKYILRGTPQWSGHLVANWFMGIGGALPFYNPEIEFDAKGPIPDALQKGDPQAISYAEQRNKGAPEGINLGQSVVISNLTPYGEAVEKDQHEKDGRAFLRPVNLPVEMVMAANDKFGQGREISAAEAIALSEETL